MKRKKVLIDLYSLKDIGANGFSQIAINYGRIFSELQNSGMEEYDFEFILPQSAKKTMKHIYPGVKCYYEHRKLSWLWKIIRWVVPHPDVWHSVNQLCRQYPDSDSTKLIFTIHDYNFLFEDAPDEAERRRKIMQSRIDRAEVVTFISKYAEKIAREHTNLEGKKTYVIYNGVEDLTDKPRQKPSFVSDDEQFFFSIGTICKKKNFEVLLDVMKHFPEKKLYLCGNTNYEYAQNMLQRIKEEGITNVIMPGIISDAERIWLYANCEAYLFPSIGEGFGLPAIEAMQFGKPVFASAYQSLPEIVEGYGYIWHDLDAESMAREISDNIDSYYADSERIKKVKEYAASYSYDKHIEAYLNIYRELLK